MFEWTQHGAYEIKLEKEVYRIFPKSKDGKSFPITIRRAYIHLRRELNDGSTMLLSFKHYLHRRNLYWSDSRHEKGSCTKHHVRKELARILFKRDEDAAKKLMEKVEALI
jgi:hypothetical protein